MLAYVRVYVYVYEYVDVRPGLYACARGSVYTTFSTRSTDPARRKDILRPPTRIRARRTLQQWPEFPVGSGASVGLVRTIIAHIYIYIYHVYAYTYINM